MLTLSVRDDEAELELETLAYPLSPAAQTDLIRLLRSEWTRTDYDWLEAMHGDYGEALAITSVLARRQGEPVSTATIHFARHHPEVAVLGGVLTDRDHRDRGLAGRVIEVALAQAKTAGCKVCLLGTARKPHNVYMRHGFAWQNGSVMRRSFGAADFEQEYFAAGQPAEIRPANWGDLPGLTLLVTQPLATVCLDYPRGLLSGRYLPLERCLSNFPVLWYETAARGGLLSVLAEPRTARVFGFGSATRAPGSGRGHTATIDFATHENYEAQLPELLDQVLAGCRQRGIKQTQAFIAAGNDAKFRGLRAAGFAEIGKLAAALKLGREMHDVVLLGKSL